MSTNFILWRTCVRYCCSQIFNLSRLLCALELRSSTRAVALLESNDLLRIRYRMPFLKFGLFIAFHMSIPTPLFLMLHWLITISRIWWRYNIALLVSVMLTCSIQVMIQFKRPLESSLTPNASLGPVAFMNVLSAIVVVSFWKISWL